MKKNSQTIFSKDLAVFHPYQGSANTDLYYVKLANKIYQTIDWTYGEQCNENNYLYLSDDEKIKLSSVITCYFEDIISETNIFLAFVTEHKNRYGKLLPFYNLSDYTEGEINTEDIQFLIWHFYMQIQGGEFPLSPLNPLFLTLAAEVMEILEEEYETAPANGKLQEYFQISENETDLYVIQPKFFWLGTASYLFFINGLKLQDTAEEVIENAKESGQQMDIPAFINILCNDFAYNSTLELLDYRPAQWLASILGKSHNLHGKLTALSPKYSGYFIFLDETKTEARFKHIATDEILTVTQKSLVGFPKEMKNENCVLHLGFVKWNDEWWFVGQVNGYEKNDDILKEINESESEKNLYKTGNNELPQEEQDQLLNEIIEQLKSPAENGSPLSAKERTEIIWKAIENPEISSATVKKAMQSKQLDHPQFEGKEGKNLLKDNFEFVLSYFKHE